MKTIFSRLAAATAVGLAIAAAGCGGGTEQRIVEGAHERKAHGAGEEAVTVSAEAMRLAGIGISEIVRRSIGRTIEMPGEISYNEEARVHITPRYAGVIREVRARLGESVRRGDVLAVIESNASLTSYDVATPIAGRVVDMHAALGEFVAEDHDLFVVADLSSVWANCEAFAEDLAFVRVGQRMTIGAIGSEDAVQSTVAVYLPRLTTKRARPSSGRSFRETVSGGPASSYEARSRSREASPRPSSRATPCKCSARTR